MIWMVKIQLGYSGAAQHLEEGCVVAVLGGEVDTETDEVEGDGAVFPVIGGHVP